MEFEYNGSFELQGVSPEMAWLVLTDPVAIERALPGCKYIRHIDETDQFDFDEYEPDPDIPMLPHADPEVVEERAFEAGEQYAAMLQIGVGDIKPSFEAVGTITERENLSMSVRGRGATLGSSFETTSSATVSENEDGSKIEWYVEADVSGKLAQMNKRVIDSVADNVVNEYFNNIEQQMLAVEEAYGGEAADEEEEAPGITARISNMIGRLVGG